MKGFVTLANTAPAWRQRTVAERSVSAAVVALAAWKIRRLNPVTMRSLFGICGEECSGGTVISVVLGRLVLQASIWKRLTLQATGACNDYSACGSLWLVAEGRIEERRKPRTIELAIQRRGVNKCGIYGGGEMTTSRRTWRPQKKAKFWRSLSEYEN